MFSPLVFMVSDLIVKPNIFGVDFCLWHKIQPYFLLLFFLPGG